MTALHPLESRLAGLWPPVSWREVTVLLAVSGGPDSVALLRAMATLKTGGDGRLCVAHFNHGLRERESEADETFVVELCRRLDVCCEVGRAFGGAAAPKTVELKEDAARAARYEFLRLTAARLGARYVATAHSADDQAETILHRILRGTGIGGLSGIARVRPLGPAATLIRPLLPLGRAELLAYLDDLRQPYRSDSSNADLRFTRNRIRHELLPELAAQFNPGVVEALLRLSALAGEVQSVIEAIVDELSGRHVAADGAGGVQISAALAGQPRYVVRELLMSVWREQGWPMQAMGFAQWDLLAELVRSCGDTSSSSEIAQKQTFPGNVLAEAVEGRLRLVRIGD